jgi:excisionase family DNA binding protein
MKDREGMAMRTGMQMATVREVATLLRLKESTVCRLASQGKLPGFKFGKAWRFDLEKIEQLFLRTREPDSCPADDRHPASERDHLDHDGTP